MSDPVPAEVQEHARRLTVAIDMAADEFLDSSTLTPAQSFLVVLVVFAQVVSDLIDGTPDAMKATVRAQVTQVLNHPRGRGNDGMPPLDPGSKVH